MNEQAGVERWIYEGLDSISGIEGRVYADLVPQGTQLPAIVFQRQAGSDRPVFSGDRIAEFVYVVRVIGETESNQQLEAIATAIDSALEKASGSEGSLTIGSVREAPFSLTETSDGVIYRHLGGTYRIRAQA